MGGKSSTSFTSACFFLPLFPFIFVIFTHLCFALSSYLSLPFFRSPTLYSHCMAAPLPSAVIFFPSHIRTSAHRNMHARAYAAVRVSIRFHTQSLFFTYYHYQYYYSFLPHACACSTSDSARLRLPYRSMQRPKRPSPSISANLILGRAYCSTTWLG